jgi:hypothetical protein
MKLTILKKACLLSGMIMGVMTATLPAMNVATASNKVNVIEKEWTLLETKNGVSCYYINGPLGTCNNAVQLLFVNSSAKAVTVNFTVETDGATITRKIVVAAGQTLEPSKESSLVIRPASSGKPVISFTVSK